MALRSAQSGQTASRAYGCLIVVGKQLPLKAALTCCSHASQQARAFIKRLPTGLSLTANHGTDQPFTASGLSGTPTNSNRLRLSADLCKLSPATPGPPARGASLSAPTAQALIAFSTSPGVPWCALIVARLSISTTGSRPHRDLTTPTQRRDLFMALLWRRGFL
jgi:hypothetical protein